MVNIYALNLIHVKLYRRTACTYNILLDYVYNYMHFISTCIHILQSHQAARRGEIQLAKKLMNYSLYCNITSVVTAFVSLIISLIVFEIILTMQHAQELKNTAS